MRARGAVTEQGQAARLDRSEGGRVPRAASEWKTIVASQRQSQLSVDEFCRREGIAKSTFWYWRKRLQAMSVVERHGSAVTEFLAIPIAGSASALVELDLPGMRIRLEGSAATRVVEAIVARMCVGVQP